MKTQKTSQWKIKLETQVQITGSKLLGLNTDNLKAEKIDEHQDLPLVCFRYPSSDAWNTPTDRLLRVTEMDNDYIKGYEGEQYKAFRRNRIQGEIVFKQLPVSY
jgi:hypothetical protein